MQKLKKFSVKPVKGSWRTYIGRRFLENSDTQAKAIRYAEMMAKGDAIIRIHNKLGQLRRVYRLLEVCYIMRWDIPKDKW